MGMNRRSFLQRSLGSTTAAGPLLATETRSRNPIIDTQVYVSRWPGRRMNGDETSALVELLRSRGVTEAWAGSFDALLQKDSGGVNSRLARECRDHGSKMLLPFGAINPKLPDWEEDLRRCHEEFRMPGVRLHPNYHNYTLRDPSIGRLLRISAERGLVVQIAAWMEDERCQHPLLRVPKVDLSPLAPLLEKIRGAKVVVLNGFTSLYRMEPVLAPFRKLANVAFDFAALDGLMEVKALTGLLGVERVVFGSYSPMFYFESASLKVREAALSEAESAMVFSGNARRLLPQS